MIVISTFILGMILKQSLKQDITLIKVFFEFYEMIRLSVASE